MGDPARDPQGILARDLAGDPRGEHEGARDPEWVALDGGARQGGGGLAAEMREREIPGRWHSMGDPNGGGDTQ